MTLQQFKFLITAGQILDSEARQVNILYNGTKIEAIAVRIENGNLNQLQQATTIILKAPEAGTTLNISLENSQVPVRTVNREITGNYFLYTIVEEDQQPEMSIAPSPTGTPSVEEYFTDIIILPQQNAEKFTSGDYDVLQNNVLINRTSQYLQVSDRTTVLDNGTNPRNLPDILQDNAIRPDIQDSLYNDTGWVNGRYNGTQTSELTFGSIQPALTGGSFQGTYYASAVEDEVIFTATERGYVQYFHTGQIELPSYIELTTFIELDADAAINTGSLTLINSNPNSKLQIEQGSLIKISGSSGLSPEVIRVDLITPIGPSESYKRLQATVQRGWNRSTQQGYTDGDDILIISPQTVYRADGAKIFQEKQGKVYVKETQEILHLDDFGQIVSSSNNLTS